MTRKYLAIFFLPVPQKEHAEIEKAVAYHSDGDYKRAFLNANRDGSGVVGYLFTSNTVPWQMGFGLLNGDTKLIVEIGDKYSEDGHNIAAAWLRSHQSRAE